MKENTLNVKLSAKPSQKIPAQDFFQISNTHRWLYIMVKATISNNRQGALDQKEMYNAVKPPLKTQNEK